MVAAMRRHGPAALACLVGGIAALAVAVAQGGAQVHLLVIVPVVTGTSPLAFVGILLILVAVMLAFVALAGRGLPAAEGPKEAGPATPQGSPAPSKSFGGVVFLGPFPLVFGSNPKVTRAMLVLGLFLFILVVGFYAAVLAGWVRLG